MIETVVFSVERVVLKKKSRESKSNEPYEVLDIVVTSHEIDLEPTFFRLRLFSDNNETIEIENEN